MTAVVIDGVEWPVEGAQVAIVPGAGHAVHLERPGDVAAIIAGPRP